MSRIFDPTDVRFRTVGVGVGIRDSTSMSVFSSPSLLLLHQVTDSLRNGSTTDPGGVGRPEVLGVEVCVVSVEVQK